VRLPAETMAAAAAFTVSTLLCTGLISLPRSIWSRAGGRSREATKWDRMAAEQTGRTAEQRRIRIRDINCNQPLEQQSKQGRVPHRRQKPARSPDRADLRSEQRLESNRKSGASSPSAAGIRPPREIRADEA
jgi:hypothetical protein